MAVGGPLGMVDRHEVQDLADAALAQEPGDQDGAVRLVELLDDMVGVLGGDAEVAALVVVEQAGEHTGAVEAGTTEPVDGAVGVHQRGGLQVTDEAVVSNWRVAVHGYSPRSRSWYRSNSHAAGSRHHPMRMNPARPESSQGDDDRRSGAA
jgi:hypothetical protein